MDSAWVQYKFVPNNDQRNPSLLQIQTNPQWSSYTPPAPNPSTHQPLPQIPAGPHRPRDLERPHHQMPQTATFRGRDVGLRSARRECEGDEEAGYVQGGYGTAGGEDARGYCVF